MFVVLLVIFAGGDESENNPPNVAKLHLTMPIYESESFAHAVKKIKENENIKGVLLVIDSPGGLVGASIEIADMIKDLAQKMPVIAYVQGSMASGSYYAGMYANEIYANRGALIGSVGVIFSGVNIEELMQKVGVKEQGIKAGAYKEIGTMTRKWSVEERQFLENLLQEQYAMFYSDVMRARGEKLKSKDYHDFAEGKVFSANKALELGLIDKVESMQGAMEELRQKVGVDKLIWLEKDKFETYMDKLFDTMSSKILSLSIPSLKATL
ncbi:signal peptide peptidase SppA [Helicobacter magdeburgensis]|uniref:Signal peptide peptidase SppA n=1 Tax=Helicobacter magdeburgensis TaxID=471858 RepID=A0A4U8T3K2_9HELI|nr:signal peptide peptidase SppA [Helicobacter magdeburgensis]